MVKYTEEDLENIIALAEQDDSNPSRSESLVRRCTSALVPSVPRKIILQFPVKSCFLTEMNVFIIIKQIFFFRLLCFIKLSIFIKGLDVYEIFR